MTTTKEINLIESLHGVSVGDTFRYRITGGRIKVIGIESSGYAHVIDVNPHVSDKRPRKLHIDTVLLMTKDRCSYKSKAEDHTRCHLGADHLGAHDTTPKVAS